MDSNSNSSALDSSVSSHVYRRLPVPSLDEETLMNGVSAISNPGDFSLVPQDTTLSANPMPGTFIVNGAHAMNSSESPMTMAVFQQHAAAAAAQLEQDYMHTRMVLQQCPRNVLLAVLTSLIDEYPGQLVNPVRVRLDQVISARPNSLSASTTPNSSAARGASRKTGSNFVPNSGAAPWTPSSHASVSGGASTTTPYNSSTSPGHRKGRGHKGREEEQELCSVHGSMRAPKHLQLNPATGLFECINGFHCLVDGPVETKMKAPEVSVHPVPNSYFPDGISGTISNNTSNPISYEGNSSRSNSALPISTTALFSEVVTTDLTPSEDDPKMDMNQLESLLQRVRDMQY